MATTPGGWPYVVPADHPLEYPAVSQTLANKLEQTTRDRPVRAGTARVFTKNAQSIPNGVNTTLVEWLPDTGDTGNGGPLTYTAGVVTCGEAGFYDVSGYVNWDSNATGIRRFDIVCSTGATWRDDRAAAPGGTCAVTLSLSGIYVPAQGTIRLNVFQQSGNALSVFTGRWLVIKVGT